MSRKAKVVSLLVAAAILFIFFPSDVFTTREEVLSAKSPEGHATAYLMLETNAVTRQTKHRLYLKSNVYPNEKAWKYPDLEIQGLKDPALAWQGRLLTVSYAQGEVVHFSSAWYDREEYIRKFEAHVYDYYTAEIRLDPHCDGMCF